MQSWRQRMHRQIFHSHVSRALFSSRSCSLSNFWLYSRSLISHTFFMMEALQPTVSLLFSLDIFRLIQTSCTCRRKNNDLPLNKHSVFIWSISEPSGRCVPQRWCPLRRSSHCQRLRSDILLPSESLTCFWMLGAVLTKIWHLPAMLANRTPKITFRDRSMSWWRLHHASGGRRGMKERCSVPRL